MFAKERQDKIYEMIQKNGAITTSHLVEIFGVSIETIRRDLMNMEQNGQLSRVHGGAVAKGNMKPFLDLEERNKEYSKEKENLAFKAVEFISEGDIIGIDAGSTAVFLAEAIRKRFSKLTVITYSLDVFQILCESFSAILCGGQYKQKENAFYGPLALDTIEKLHIQKMFLCPSAVSLEHGICDYQSELFQVQRQMMKSSDNVFVLADSSKFEKKALLKLEDMQSDYCYITDYRLSEEIRKLYQENNIKIYTGKI